MIQIERVGITKWIEDSRLGTCSANARYINYDCAHENGLLQQSIKSPQLCTRLLRVSLLLLNRNGKLCRSVRSQR